MADKKKEKKDDKKLTFGTMQFDEVLSDLLKVKPLPKKPRKKKSP